MRIERVGCWKLSLCMPSSGAPRLLPEGALHKKCRALIERHYSRTAPAHTVGAVYDRPGFFVQSRLREKDSLAIFRYRLIVEDQLRITVMGVVVASPVLLKSERSGRGIRNF